MGIIKLHNCKFKKFECQSKFVNVTFVKDTNKAMNFTVRECCVDSCRRLSAFHKNSLVYFTSFDPYKLLKMLLSCIQVHEMIIANRLH
jgi:hypothetical protein